MKHMIRVFRKVFPFLALFVVLVGTAVVLVLLRHNQDVRNQAFTGYTLTTDSGQKVTTTVFALANQSDMILNSFQANTTTVPGLFYTLGETYKDAKPDLQLVYEPALRIYGKIFLKYDVLVNKSFLFMRLENLPLATGKFIHIWLNKTDGSYVPLSVGVVRFEKGLPIMYGIAMTDGDLHLGAKDLVISYDQTLKRGGPETEVVRVHF